MKNILLLVHQDDGQEARLQTALDLTRALDGHLTCLDVTASPVIAGDLYAGFGEGALLVDEREQEADNKASISRRLIHEGVSWSWTDVTGDIATCLLDAATLADLIVVNRKLDGYPLPDMHAITSRILMHARKPIVAVPQKLRCFAAHGRALIAWDGHASSTATMCACVPLLQLASDVHIFLARDGEKASPTEAAEYLSRHDIHPSINVIHDGLKSADTLIMEEARSWGADYILMGAYSHGRLLETFGGVTKRMLSKSELPLVIGH